MIALTLAAPGDPVRADLDQVRVEIAKLQAAIADLKEAPLPLEDAVQRALDSLRARASSGENGVAGFARPEGPAYTGAPRETRDVLALMFALAPDLVEKGLRSQLKLACRDGVSLVNRKARTDELRGRLEGLLVREEELAVTLLLGDVTVERSIPESVEEIKRVLEVWDRTAA